MIRRHLPLALAPLALAMAGCATAPSTPFIVFFTDDSALLQPVALDVLRSAANNAAANPQAPVLVRGFAGVDGGRAFSRELSAARAERVASQLAEYGVARNRITVSARSAVAPELAAEEARRVEVRVGG